MVLLDRERTAAPGFVYCERGSVFRHPEETKMSIRKLAIVVGALGLLASPALAQSVQDSNTYPGSVPDTPQSENLRGQNDYDAGGPTGMILEPAPVPDPLDGSGYEGAPNDDMPLGGDEEPVEPGPQ